MPEDFSKVFTVELFTSKEVFEVVGTYNGLNEAIQRFRELMLQSHENIARITSPTDTSIYEETKRYSLRA